MINQRASCFVIGESTLTVQSMEILLRSGVHIVGVLTPEETVSSWAKSKGINVFSPKEDLERAFHLEPFDYLFSIVNFWIVPKEILELAKKAAVNFHDGPLPAYAGYNAAAWAVSNGERKYAITWHLMNSGVDAGGVLLQHPVEIGERDTSFVVNANCYQAAIASFPMLVDGLLNGTLVSQPQDLSSRTYFGRFKRPPLACLIDWTKPAHEIFNLCRALNFGRYPNPLGLPKVQIGGDVYIVSDLDILETDSSQVPGLIRRIEAGSLVVATATKDLLITGLLTLEGGKVSLEQIAAKYRLEANRSRLDLPAPADEEYLTREYNEAARHEPFWLERIQNLQPVQLEIQGTPDPAGGLQFSSLRETFATPVEIMGAFASFFAKRTGSENFDLGYSEASLDLRLGPARAFLADVLPFRVQLSSDISFRDVCAAMEAERKLVLEKASFSRDLWLRYPELGHPVHLPVAVRVAPDLELGANTEAVLILLLNGNGGYRFGYRSDILSPESFARLETQFEAFVEHALNSPSTAISHLPLLIPAERRALASWNATARPYDRNALIHQLFEVQVDRTPDGVALVFEDQKITYQELNRKANRLAHYLQSIGVGPESMVGICMPRSLDLVIGLMAILKAGGAYIPLDPTYPPQRLAQMLESPDSIVLTIGQVPAIAGISHARILNLRNLDAEISTFSDQNPESGCTSENRAYVIYTSGSTGRPKGVEVLHRNVANFFAGMDDRLPGGPGSWLAVTSISFDISVLEIFWTLARGFQVVLQGDTWKVTARTGNTPRQPVEFSLAYFASDSNTPGSGQYRLLLEGARFADRNGFQAIWTPERHFHAFGGIYPNPSVIGAAIAAVTERVHIRAGSVVLPLHHPLRVVEEWSVVDNLSNGRVGISFASGWQANDFVFAPQNYANSKQVMTAEVDRVRSLWRGESGNFVNGKGVEIAVQTLPRPVQKELPVWITAAGNPETFRLAGEKGTGLLTHLLGQRVEELAEKIKIYRKSWREAGHPGNGHVSLMIHTFLGDSVDEVREKVRKPLSDYLRSSIDLLKNSPWAFPTFAHKPQAADGSASFTPEDIEAIVAYAFDRYFEVNGLFGTPETCLGMVELLREAGVDEIASLIDFGVETEDVIRSFELLKQLKERSNEQIADFSIPAQIRRYGVTHLQCTPSMAQMLVSDAESRSALGRLRCLMVGGEALSQPLAQALLEAVPDGELHNMYGPTETTIWSTTCRMMKADKNVSIGRPIANTQCHIVDRHLQPLPIGAAGELLIGGEGVVRGYLNRPELTEERFVPDPFNPGGRLYRTGDLARYRPDGQIEFCGRLDQQVKVRGFRIELGEIETALLLHPDINTAVVVARQDLAVENQLLAYVTTHSGSEPESQELRSFLQVRLPDHMIPIAFIHLQSFPLTPNGKINRQALPLPDPRRKASAAAYLAPNTELEQIIASAWQEALSLDRIGLEDNFFDLGAHSLLMFQVNGKLKTLLSRELPLIQMFRYPTVSSLAKFLEEGDRQTSTTLAQSANRAESRRQMMTQRIANRQRQ